MLRTIGEVDQTLIHLRRLIDESGDAVELHQLLTSPQFASEIITQYSVLSADGFLRASSMMGTPPPLDLERPRALSLPPRPRYGRSLHRHPHSRARLRKMDGAADPPLARGRRHLRRHRHGVAQARAHGAVLPVDRCRADRSDLDHRDRRPCSSHRRCRQARALPDWSGPHRHAPSERDQQQGRRHIPRHRAWRRPKPHRYLSPDPRSAPGRQPQRYAGTGLRQGPQRCAAPFDRRRRHDADDRGREHAGRAQPAAPPARQGPGQSQRAPCPPEVGAAGFDPGQHGPGHLHGHQGPSHRGHQPAGGPPARPARGVPAQPAELRGADDATRRPAANMPR